MLSALKNFGVTFLISAVVFGVIAYFATGFVTNTVNDILENEKSELSDIIQDSETDDNNTETQIKTEEPTTDSLTNGKKLNFLVITTDDRSDIYDDYEPSLDIMYNKNANNVDPKTTVGCLTSGYRKKSVSSIVLVHIDSDKKQYVYTYLSPETRVYTNSGYLSLSDVFYLNGSENLTDYIFALTGLDISYIFTLNAYNMDEFISKLGSTQVYLPKDIYSSGKGYTTLPETPIERYGEDGSRWTDHIYHTLAFNAGAVFLEDDNMYKILSCVESDITDYQAKESFTISLLQYYLRNIISTEQPQRNSLIRDLIIINDHSASNDDLPFSTTPMTEDEQNPDKPDAESGPFWKAELKEPDTPIIETAFTMDNYEIDHELFEAINSFESVTVSYPCRYVNTSDEPNSYFEPDIKEGIELFLQYR